MMVLQLVRSGIFSFYKSSEGLFAVPSIQCMFVFHTTCYFCNRMSKV